MNVKRCYNKKEHICLSLTIFSYSLVELQMLKLVLTSTIFLPVISCGKAFLDLAVL